MNAGSEARKLAIRPKDQLKDARRPDEDWTGKADPKERRKLQNRLHQRAWRRRKIEQLQATMDPAERHEQPAQHSFPLTADLQNQNNDPLVSAFEQAASALMPAPSPYEPQPINSNVLEPQARLMSPDSRLEQLRSTVGISNIDAHRSLTQRPIPLPHPVSPMHKHFWDAYVPLALHTDPYHQNPLHGTTLMHSLPADERVRAKPLNVHDLMGINLHFGDTNLSSDSTPASALPSMPAGATLASIPASTAAPLGTTSNFNQPLHLIPPVIPYLAASHQPQPHTPFTFPLAPDHYLITLIQYNVLRAMLTNLRLCSLLSTIPQECQAALHIPAIPTPSTLPPSFHPTPIQQATPHDPWMNSIPDPKLRDNIILASISASTHSANASTLPPATPTGGRGGPRVRELDQEALCNDMVGGLYEGYNDCQTRGFMVWSEPWQTSSWEVSEGFVKKWGWLLDGCVALIRSTNCWREMRGEEPLVVEVEQ